VIKDRIPTNAHIGIYCLKNSIDTITNATRLVFNPNQYNPYDHSTILCIMKERNNQTDYHVLGTIEWKTLELNQWSFTVSQLNHSWDDKSLGEQHVSMDIDVNDNDLFVIMLGTTFQQQLMTQQTPDFNMDYALNDLKYLVRNMHMSSQAIVSERSNQRSIPWIALWMVSDIIGDSQFSKTCMDWEELDFMNKMSIIIDKYGERGMAKLFAYNKLSTACVVDITDLDLRWFYTQHRKTPFPRPQCMFKVPLEDIQGFNHSPWQPIDGCCVRISFRELPQWLWHRQCMLRRRWNTNMYKNVDNIPLQMQTLVKLTQDELRQRQESQKVHIGSTGNNNNMPKTLDFEDFIMRAPPCVQRAIQQTQWEPVDYDVQINTPSKRYWLKNEARNQIIRGAAESGYPKEFIQKLLLQTRRASPEGTNSEDLNDLKRLVSVKDQMKYPCMNCEQIRTTQIEGFECVWKTPHHDEAKYMCHSNFIIEHSECATMEQHREDMGHFKKPSFYWQKSN
jgi:hypothetical protein